MKNIRKLIGLALSLITVNNLAQARSIAVEGSMASELGQIAKLMLCADKTVLKDHHVIGYWERISMRKKLPGAYEPGEKVIYPDDLFAPTKYILYLKADAEDSRKTAPFLEFDVPMTTVEKVKLPGIGNRASGYVVINGKKTHLTLDFRPRIQYALLIYFVRD